MTQTIDVGSEKQLFLDDKWFFDQRGMKLTVNPPMKTERVMVAEKPWEASRIGGGNVIEDEGIYKMWYTADAPGNTPHQRSRCYATSEDGVYWERRDVNLFNWEGHGENNIVMPGAGPGGVMLDPNGQDEHRFKAIVRVRENDVWTESRGAIFQRVPGSFWSELYLCTSPDGIHWTRREPSALPFVHDTANQLIYDTRINRYVAYVRTMVRGRTVGRVELDDPLDLPWPYQQNPNAQHGPGRSQREEGGELPVALTADESDPPGTDLYTPGVHQYPWATDAYFSFTTPFRQYPDPDPADTDAQGKDERGRFRNDGTVEVQLAVSRDGISWSRPDRRPYVPLGLKGSWDGGQLYMGLGMVRKGDEIWQYYHGTIHTHGAYDFKDATHVGGIARLVQRLDGFVSADAEYTGAEFTTPLLTFTGSHLQLNADCSAMGEIWVEVRDERNWPVPGYTMEESVSVDRNQTAAPVTWREHDNVGQLTGRPVRLHFKLRACKLYAFQFAGGM